MINKTLLDGAPNLSGYLDSMQQLQKKCVRNESDWEHICSEEFVLKHGKPYTSQALTKEELAYVKRLVKQSRCKFPIKQCYSNSQRFLLLTKHLHSDEMPLKYVEGYCLSLIPFMHGWVELNGKVLDFTLRIHDEKEWSKDRLWMQDRALGSFSGREYVGVAFTLEEVAEKVLSSKEYGSMIDNPTQGWPMLKDGGEGCFSASRSER